MTTIAYKDGIVAYDSRLTRGDYILTDKSDKKHETDKNVFFMSGSIDEYPMFVEMFEGGKIKPKWELDVSAFVWSKGLKNLFYAGTFERNGDISVFSSEIMELQAIGSGSQFAVSAMDHGKTAKEAVEYAMTRDPGTGGVVYEFKIGYD